MNLLPDKRDPEGGIYEKSEDREAENAVAARFSAQVGYTCYKLDRLNHIDFRVTTVGKDDVPETVAFLEVRRRLIPSTRYKTVFVDQPKYDYIQTKGRLLNLPTYFVFVYNDRSLFLNLTTAPEYELGKAKGRGNCTVARSTDYGPTYYITVSDLQPFS